MDPTTFSSIDSLEVDSPHIFQLLFDQLKDGLGLYTLDGRVIAFNKTALRDIGQVPLENVVGKNLRELFGDVDGKVYETRMQDAIKSGTRLEYRDRIVLDGRQTWYQTVYQPIVRPDGTPQAMLLRSVNITEQVKIETELRRHATLLNTVGEAVIATDLQGRIIFWNRAAETLYQWSSDEVLGKNIIEVTPSDATQEQGKEIFANMQQGNLWKGEFFVKRKDGVSFPAFVTNMPFYDEDGNLMGIIGISRDISELKATQKKLTSTLDTLQIAVDGGEIGLWHINLEENTNFINDYWAEMIGYTREDVGTNLSFFWEHLHPDDIPRAEESLRQHTERETPMIDLVVRMRTKSGEWKWIHDKGKIIQRNEKDEPVVVAGTHVDLTKQKLAEQKILEQKGFLDAVFYFTNVLFFVYDALPNENFQLAYISKAVEKIFGYHPDQITGKKLHELTNALHPHHIALIKHHLTKVINTGLSQTIEHNMGTNDSPSWWLTTLSPVTDETGTIFQIVGTSIEVTDQHNAQTALRQSEERYMQLIENANYGVLVTQKWQILFANQYICQLLNVPQHKIVGENLQDFVNDPDIHAVGTQLYEKSQPGESYRHRFAITTQEVPPRVLHIETNSTAITYEGQPAIQTLIQDVTEQEKAIMERKILRKQIQDYAIALEKEIAERNRELQTVFSLAALITEKLDQKTIFDRILQRTLREFPACIGTIHLLDKTVAGQPPTLKLVTHSEEIFPELLKAIQFIPTNEGLTGIIFREKKLLHVPDLASDSRRRIPPVFYQSYLGAPLEIRGEVRGVLTVARRIGEGSFSDTEVRLFHSIVNQISIVMENVQLRERVEKSATLEERARLARELHDSVSQALYSLSLLAETNLQAIQNNDFETIAQNAHPIRNVTNQAIKEMRLLLHELRPPDLTQEGLIGAIQKRLNRVESRSGLNTQLIIQGEPTFTLSEDEHLYRIILEALNNALHHAEAENIEVHLSGNVDGTNPTIQVIDDGKGFDPAKLPSGTMGLYTMKTRAEKIGFQLLIKSSPNTGTNITIQRQSPS